MKLAFPLVAALLQAQTAVAAQDTTACDIAAFRASETYAVPPKIMLAIARVETGRDIDGTLQPWPWAINQGGASHWFDSQTKAEDFVLAAMNKGHTNIDIGCFQLNLRWHGEAFSSIQEMFDPETNANYAAQFLRENHQRKGNWVDAVAAYHSATPALAEAYVEKVERALNDLAENSPEPLPKAEAPPPPPHRFPLLHPGGIGAMASLVPTNFVAAPLLAASP